MAFFDDDQEARTERPTERRRREARERGMVARSTEFVVAARVLATWAVISLWAMSFTTIAAQLVADSFRRISAEPITASGALSQASQAILVALSQISTPLLIATGAVLVSHFVQVGWLWQPERAAPDITRLSPISGLARTISFSSVGKVFLAVIKLTLLLAIGSRIVSDLWQQISAKHDAALQDQLLLIGSGVTRLVSSMAIAALVWGIADYFLQRWRFERALQMTKEELRQESKDVEGNPQIRHQRLAAARKLVAQRE